MRKTPVFLLASLGLATSAHALDFNLITTLPTNSAAYKGFQAAAKIWSDRFSDPVTINLTVNTQALSGNAIGQTSSSRTTYDYSSFRSAMAADRTSALDDAAVAGLDVGSSYGFAINGTSSAANYGVHTATSSLVSLTNANAKALGLYRGTANSDASIVFNSNYAFDYDRSDGIASNQFDFIGVAAHEIGHALGFVSGVDQLDYFSYANSTTDATVDVYHSALDMFRYASVGGRTQRAFLVGNGYSGDGTVQFDSRFSVDGSLTGPRFSTGTAEGDGNQASHWKDDYYTGTYLGIMDPTGDFGDRLTTSDNDFAAFDAIGYNLTAVPEPSTFAVLGLGAAALLRRRKRA